MSLRLRMLDLLLPSACALCGLASEGAVCAGCEEQFLAPRLRCARCGNPVASGGPCADCIAGGGAFDATVVAADYARPLDQLVLQLKFGARLALAPWCARVLRDAVLARRGMALPELLCPVPLGAGRLAGRGYNQALEIARPLAKALGMPLEPRLALRARETLAQSTVAPGERRRNIRGAFTLAPHTMALVRGRHIGVVDDVMTSGATLEELAATLKRFGAARVSNFVFARTPPH
jgi:ComF family protein